LPEIIDNPTHLGVHTSQGGIEFIKKYEDNVMVAVRTSKKDVLYVRCMYCITEDKVEKYLENESIKKIKPERIYKIRGLLVGRRTPHLFIPEFRCGRCLFYPQ